MHLFLFSYKSHHSQKLFNQYKFSYQSVNNFLNKKAIRHLLCEKIGYGFSHSLTHFKNFTNCFLITSNFVGDLQRKF